MVMVVLDFDGIEVCKYQILENCFHNIFKFVLFLFESFEMTTIKVRAVEITNPLETYFLDMMQNVKGERVLIYQPAVSHASCSKHASLTIKW